MKALCLSVFVLLSSQALPAWSAEREMHLRLTPQLLWRPRALGQGAVLGLQADLHDAWGLVGLAEAAYFRRQRTARDGAPGQAWQHANIASSVGIGLVGAPLALWTPGWVRAWGDALQLEGAVYLGAGAERWLQVQQLFGEALVGPAPASWHLLWFWQFEARLGWRFADGWALHSLWGWRLPLGGAPADLRLGIGCSSVFY